MKKIAIINAYGDKNIGDAAILNVALEFIQEVYKEIEISLMIENKDSYGKFTERLTNVNILQLPYGYAIQSTGNSISFILKITRFIKIYLLSLFLIIFDLLRIHKLPKKGFYSYINALKEANIVIGMGGGYLIAKNPIADFFGLTLTLLPIYIAKIYKKKIVFLPISFGPFASSMQEKIAFNALKNTTVMARDEITLAELKKLNKGKKVNMFYAPDLALFFNNHSYDIEKKIKSNYIVLTAREWLSKVKQEEYEKSLAEFVDYIWEKYKLKTIFIAMAMNKIEDDDNLVAERIKGNIVNKNIFEVKEIESLEELQKIIGLSRLTVCTRMHSAVISLTVETPFIAIGYVHKTLGLLKKHNLEEWYIDMRQLNTKNLINILDLVLKHENYMQFINVIKHEQKSNWKYKEFILKGISL